MRTLSIAPEILLAFVVSVLLCCIPREEKGGADNMPISFSLADYYTQSTVLDSLVDLTWQSLTPEAKAGQMIVSAAGGFGKPDEVIDGLVRSQGLGGILLLNGSVDTFRDKVRHFDSLNQIYGGLPLIYSADAEPSLVNRKIDETTQVPKTIELKDPEQSGATARIIAGDLNSIGIKQNFAPVVDLSISNEAITNRSFGSHPDTVIAKALAFIENTQDQGIVATAKHFPGHGLVKGDSHSRLVYIDGSMNELGVYDPLIKNGVLSIMVGHIAIRNNPIYDTKGLPATCSRAIVTELLRDSLGFKGLIVTDAMNMGALSEIDNAPLMAAFAGCDLILMPPDENKLRADIMDAVASDPNFEKQVEISVKRIIRMKYCLDLTIANNN